MAFGGKQPGAGRPKGALNKATADVKLAAQAYTEEALKTLAKIMKTGASEAARVAAANSILDRGHGKPKQTIDGPGPNGEHLQRVVNEIIDPANPNREGLRRSPPA